MISVSEAVQNSSNMASSKSAPTWKEEDMKLALDYAGGTWTSRSEQWPCNLAYTQ